ncbi:hypothetical protein LWC08_09790 [Desulfobaculum bizertense]|uniref:putative nucleotide-diphospho-sugar transferase n=1 Tax=Desulfobaculum bizertense TaxID=376490 RepID=UPI001F38F8CF|nr:putative nucleotide-diphospho-sugar transferase [Desulfobaculum bizertense]UIJ37028.1 hypothetical protein LWC08_09790 [Desulfobaculum bizertense]
METINVITCVDKKFEKYAKNLKEICAKLTHIHLWVYDIGPQEEQLDVADFKLFATDNYSRKDKNNHIIANHKPIIIKHFLTEKKANCLCIDADCIFTGDLAPSLFEQVDIGVTPRALREQKAAILRNGLINTGFLYFSYSQEMLAFLDRWAEACADGGVSDQKALSDILETQIDLVDGDNSQRFDGFNVFKFDPDVYNDVTCKTGKIFHCKSVARRKSKYRAYCVLSTMMKLCPHFCDALISFNRKHRLLVYRRKKNEVYQKRLEG